MAASPKVVRVAKPYAFSKFSLFGTIMTVQDWSLGVSFTSGAALSSDDLHAILSLQLNTAVQNAWVGNGGTYGIGDICSADTTLQGIRAYYYPSGTTKAATQAEYLYPAPLTGAAGGAVPTQTALVASTMTGKPGRTNRGRIYMPATGIPLTGHQLAAVGVNDLATNMAAMLTAFNAITGVGAPLRCVVAGAASAVPITSIRVDSRPDIQRRRADKLIATNTGNATVS